ncbi:putative 3-hydroxyacyl-CoA dehydrogenase NAD binding domain-containing protein [Seiridium cardinale]|uniref:3-hydroxyacyl-CoA dehydrogenase NAD binding domain-containing protein n=1 Tax=Seiridium cardinale TaxID=138064 RepID=A0ABR2X8B0_9PEZI
MSSSARDTWDGPKNWRTRPVCILGGGVLGRRIAACFLAAGHNVIVRDPSAKAREESLAYIHANINTYLGLTLQSPGNVEAVEDLSAAVANCWLVIEAVPEVLSLKESTFADLERFAPADCILATNSSSYKSGDLLSKVREDSTKSRVLNVHFMMPPEALIVELMTCGCTTDSIFPFLSDRLREAGLHPVTALKDSTGFIFNRIWAAIKREVLSVLAEGVSTPEIIDAIWIEQYAKRKVGPCRMMDSVGLDTVEHIEVHYLKERNLPSYHLEWLKKNYIDQGKLGNKTTTLGGLYPAPASGSQTNILLLNTGLAEPLKGKTPEDIQNSGEVLQLNVDNPGALPVRLVGKLPAPDGIDVFGLASPKRMYWTNMGHPKQNDGSIQSANIDGSDIQYVVKPGSAVHTPKQLTIDQESRKIYCCDREGLRIVRCNLDGSELEVIYQSGDWAAEPEKKENPTYWPVGIALSTKHGKLFWTQKGHSKANEGRIFAAGLKTPADPAKRDDVELIISDLPECIDLEFDDETDYLYWTDRGELPLGNTLNRKRIFSDKPASSAETALGREILAQGLGEGIGLRLDRANNCLYVADLGGHLWKCSTEGGREKLYEGATHAYTGVAFYKV